MILTATLSGLSIQVKTSKDRYYVGEGIQVLVTVPDIGELTFGNLPQTLYQMDGRYVSTEVFLPVVSYAETPRTWTNTHSWSRYGLSVGSHEVIGILNGYGESTPASFMIIEPPRPRGTVLIDFDRIPDTDCPVADLAAYEVSGVHFHTSQGAAVRLSDIEGDSWIEGFDPYPVGFHVIADLTNRVFAASSKVAGGICVRITMVARSADGRAIGSDVSRTVVNPGRFEQTLSIRATEPIASLEWWPSQSNSMCGVDDLLLVATPIPHATLQDATLRLAWPTIAGTEYQLWVSADLKAWSPWGSPRAGTGSTLGVDFPCSPDPVRFFQLTDSP